MIEPLLSLLFAFTVMGIGFLTLHSASKRSKNRELKSKTNDVLVLKQKDDSYQYHNLLSRLVCERTALNSSATKEFKFVPLEIKQDGDQLAVSFKVSNRYPEKYEILNEGKKGFYDETEVYVLYPLYFSKTDNVKYGVGYNYKKFDIMTGLTKCIYSSYELESAFEGYFQYRNQFHQMFKSGIIDMEREVSRLENEAAMKEFDEKLNAQEPEKIRVEKHDAFATSALTIEQIMRYRHAKESQII